MTGSGGASSKRRAERSVAAFVFIGSPACAGDDTYRFALPACAGMKIDRGPCQPRLVMPGLVPGIHVFGLNHVLW